MENFNFLNQAKPTWKIPFSFFKPSLDAWFPQFMMLIMTGQNMLKVQQICQNLETNIYYQPQILNLCWEDEEKCQLWLMITLHH